MGGNAMQRLGRVMGRVLAAVALCGMASLLLLVGAETLSSATFLYDPDRYGTIYLYETTPGAWDPGDIPAMEAALQEAKDLGFDTIIQTFPLGLLGSGNEEWWLLFLDAAQAVEVDVVAYLWPSYTYTGDPDNPFYYDDLKAFLEVVGDHPALLGYLGLREPLEPQAGISGDELGDFYTEMKNHAPDLKIVHYLGNIAYWDEQRDDLDFSDGMCDICIVWYYPFRYVGTDPVFEEDLVLSVVQPNLALVNERDPDAELWFLGQAFARAAHPRNLRMPTPDEMEALYLLVMQEPVDGFVWYSWYHTEMMADASLGDEGMEDQQAKVGDIVDEYTGFANLEMSKLVSPVEGTLYPGDSVTYTLTFTNYGPHVPSDVVITDLVPDELFTPTIVGSSGVVVTPTHGITFSWTVEPLQVAASGMITLTGVVNPGLESTTVITNTAVISSPVASSSATLSSTVTLMVSRKPKIYLPLVFK